MFDIGYSELLLIAIVTLLVVGPKELPNLLRNVGKWTGKARAMARHFRSGFDTMIREAEIEEMNKQWAAHNEAIMAAPDLTDLPEPERDADIEAFADLPAPAPAAIGAPAPADVAPPPVAPQAAVDDAAPPKAKRARKPKSPASPPPAP